MIELTEQEWQALRVLEDAAKHGNAGFIPLNRRPYERLYKLEIAFREPTTGFGGWRYHINPAGYALLNSLNEPSRRKIEAWNKSVSGRKE